MDELDGLLTPEMADRLKAHLSKCPACEEERNALVGLYSDLKRVEEVEPPEDFTAQVLRLLPEASPSELAAERPEPHSWWRRFAPVTAMTMVTLVATTLAFPNWLHGAAMFLEAIAVVVLTITVGLLETGSIWAYVAGATLSNTDPWLLALLAVLVLGGQVGLWRALQSQE
jgi:anti-sigma factor RsiW